MSSQTKDDFSFGCPPTGPRPSFAVQIINASLTAGGRPILDKCNLEVPEASIYSLLGPSGCGKTTLLRCVLRRLRPHRGQIKLFGSDADHTLLRIPGSDVGYMPQDLALSMSFTAEETLTYYGKMHRMSTKAIEQRIRFLMQLLHLTDYSKQLLSKMSGGQQRRVAIAVALIHLPRLLILDEPTVGIDSLLRQMIWQHLTRLCRSGLTTVLITTHYIEEAGAAETVGFMRNGRVLEEANPRWLMTEYKCRSLQDVFLKLCQDQDNHNDNDSTTSATNESTSSDDSAGCSSSSSSNDCTNQTTVRPTKDLFPHHKSMWRKLFGFRPHQVPILMENQLIKTRRNFWAITIFYLLLPSVYMSIYCVSFGKMAKNIPLAVFNQEQPPDVSEQVLDLLNSEHIKQTTVNSLSEAINAVRTNKAWAAIQFRPNYTQFISRRVADGPLASNETIAGSDVHLYMDMTNPIVGFTIFHQVVKAVEKSIGDFLIEEGQNPKIVSMPWSIEEVIYGSNEPSMTDYKAPGFLSIGLFFVALTLAGWTVITEKTDGLLERKAVNGVGAAETVISHFVIQSALMTGQLILQMMVVYWLFDLPMAGNLIEAFFMLLAIGTSGISFGFLLAALLPGQTALIVVSNAVNFCFIFICGIIWPLETMPRILQQLAVVMPLTHPVNALRCIVNRGWSALDSLAVAQGFIAAGVMTVGFLAVTIFALRRITACR